MTDDYESTYDINGIICSTLTLKLKQKISLLYNLQEDVGDYWQFVTVDTLKSSNQTHNHIESLEEGKIHLLRLIQKNCH